jgi:hypothetical protein
MNGHCIDDPCVSVVEIDELCPDNCMLKVINNKNKCVLDPCAIHDNIHCTNYLSIRCDVDSSLGVCHTHNCTYFNVKFYFTFFVVV